MYDFAILVRFYIGKAFANHAMAIGLTTSPLGNGQKGNGHISGDRAVLGHGLANAEDISMNLRKNMAMELNSSPRRRRLNGRTSVLGLALPILLPMLLIPAPALADVKAGVDAWSRQDFTTAVRQWQGPAEKGDADALFNLGQAHKLGKGVPQDLARAEVYFAKAAAQGHLQAADNYGLLLFQRGQHVQAIPYIRDAADRGDPRAQYVLGIAHFNGDNVAKDWVRAYALASLAQQAELPQAKAALAQMDQYIPLDQRQRGIALASELGAQAEANRQRAATAMDLGTPARPPVRTAAAAPAPLPPLAPPARPAPLAAPSRPALANADRGQTSLDLPQTYRPPAYSPPSAAPAAATAPPPAPRPVRGLPPAPTAKPGMAIGSGQSLSRPMGQAYSPYGASGEPAPRGPWDANSANSDNTPRPGRYLTPHLPRSAAAPDADPAPVASRSPAPRPAPRPQPQAAPAPTPARPNGTGTGWAIQLGAFGVAGNAEALWAKVKGNAEITGHPRQLLPSGKVTRLLAGGYSQDGAAAACRKLTSQAIACLPVKD